MHDKTHGLERNNIDFINARNDSYLFLDEQPMPYSFELSNPTIQ